MNMCGGTDLDAALQVLLVSNMTGRALQKTQSSFHMNVIIIHTRTHTYTCTLMGEQI